MKKMLAFIFSMLFVLLARGAAAQEDPPCLNPNNTVPATVAQYHNEWLTKDGADVVKEHLWKVAGNSKKRWERDAEGRDTLVITCIIQGGGGDMNAAMVEGKGSGAKEAEGGKSFFSSLAGRTGHTQQEADVLYQKHSTLGYFRSVSDPDNEGQEVSEETLILRRIEKRLGIGASPSASNKSEGREQQIAELKKKIEAAKKRGDMNELMRLAQEGQKMAAPEIAQAEKFQEKTDQQ
ncbi:MAG: hypothetical protein NT147_03555, partial [Candidatus Aminicenantes bacterium]|nr:hypothetical protein [Candidatus Aminicenantes bacterium]